MASVYSVSIFQEAGVDGDRAVLVPEDSILVVRDIWSFWNSETELFAKLYVRGDFGQTFWYSLWTAVDANPISYWQGRMVLTEGLSLTTTNPVDVSISGYQLTLP